MALTYDLRQLDQLAHRLRTLADPDALGGIVEGLADLWVDTAKAKMGKDTRQLFNRTAVQHVRSTKAHAEAVVVADTPYAGFHNYGTRYQAPNRFWNQGRDMAVRRTDRLGGQIGTQIGRVLESGGVWNPHQLF